MKSRGARSSGDVVRRLLGTLWEMLRDASAVGAKWFGKSFGRWFDGSFVRATIGSFVRSIARRKNYIRKTLREFRITPDRPKAIIIIIISSSSSSSSVAILAQAI